MNCHTAHMRLRIAHAIFISQNRSTLSYSILTNKQGIYLHGWFWNLIDSEVCAMSICNCCLSHTGFTVITDFVKLNYNFYFLCVCVLKYDQEISLLHVAATPIQPCSYIQRIMWFLFIISSWIFQRVKKDGVSKYHFFYLSPNNDVFCNGGKFLEALNILFTPRVKTKRSEYWVHKKQYE